MKQTYEYYQQLTIETYEQTIKQLSKQINNLNKQLSFYKERFKHYKTKTIQLNKQNKELQTKLNNSIPKLRTSKQNNLLQQIQNIEQLLTKEQPKMLYKARLEQLRKLKQTVGLPIYNACCFNQQT